MKNLEIKATENSPKVILDYDKNFIEFEGESYPEDTFGFYEPIIKCLKDFLKEKEGVDSIMNIKLTYFNSSTTQVLFDIFDLLEESNTQNLTINWYYDASNEDGMQDYEDYADEFPDLNIKAIPFNN